MKINPKLIELMVRFLQLNPNARVAYAEHEERQRKVCRPNYESGEKDIARLYADRDQGDRIVFALTEGGTLFHMQNPDAFSEAAGEYRFVLAFSVPKRENTSQIHEALGALLMKSHSPMPA